MSTTTTNLGLVKPELTDPADITMMNQNWDKIDEEIKNLEIAGSKFNPEDYNWKSYNSLDQISDTLTINSTPAAIASAMPDYSVLTLIIYSYEDYNGGLVPNIENGLLIIKRSNITRCTFEFLGELTGQYYAYMRSNVGTWSGWKKLAVSDTFEATITTSWTNSGAYYFQDIDVSGIKSTDNPIVDILPVDNNETNVQYSEAMCKVFRITTSAGSIRVWATEAIEIAFPIQLKVVR